jgi:hypothetical protein
MYMANPPVSIHALGWQVITCPMQFQRQGMVSVPVILSLIFAEILGDIACPLSILLVGWKLFGLPGLA